MYFLIERSCALLVIFKLTRYQSDNDISKQRSYKRYDAKQNIVHDSRLSVCYNRLVVGGKFPSRRFCLVPLFVFAALAGLLVSYSFKQQA